MTFDRVHTGCPAHHCCRISGTGADFQYTIARLQLRRLYHESDHVRLRDRLTFADRQRTILVGEFFVTPRYPWEFTVNAHSTIALRTGAQMPMLGLGTWELTDDTAGTVAHALDIGYRMIDTACDYGSQRGIGEAIRRRGKRESVYLVTKVEETDDTYQATKTYLGEIGADYADLMLIHRPPPDGAGEALWAGLVRASKEGLARDIGVSNYSIEQMQSLARATGEMPVVNQIEWSPFGHSMEMLRFCKDNGVVIQAYSPLTRGERLADGRLNEIATRYGRTPAQILIRWNLQLGTVPLPKANRKQHLGENIEVFEFEITQEDMATLNSLNEQYSSLGSLAYV